MSPQPINEPIAVIGSACRFAGGTNSTSKLWELLKEPRDVLSEIPESRFNAQGFYHSDGLYHGHSNVRHSYLLSEDPRLFDAQFFGVKPVEARALDPQQRFLLETVYEGLESAGLTIEGLRGSNTAVYAGLMCNDYEAMMLRDHNSMPSYYAVGIGRSVMSNRISYFFDWHGPSMTIDTACSSSLYAVHLAVQALRAGETQTALACGSNIILGPENYISESKLKMLSPDSRSRMWDENANGYARGDGVACVVLKTLSAALADGDHIDCVIRETGVNQDGATNGITMPSASAQRNLIQDTYARAGLDPLRDGRCQYFEAHGTGTPAGDPIEAEAIQTSFFEGNDSKHGLPKHQDPLYVGSIKTVLGHTEGTAGVAAILKAGLAVQNGYIPANMLFDRLNPSIEPFYNGLQVPTSTKSWPALPPGQPRRASVNSFGFGGANAHAIIENYDPSSNKAILVDATQYGPYVFSANSEQALAANLGAYSNFLREHGNTMSARDLAWTLRQRRSTLPVKVAFPAGSVDKLRESIDAALQDSKAKKAPIGARSALSESPRVLGVFTGQGAQYARMGAELIEKSPFAQRILHELEEYLAQLPPMDRPSWLLTDELLALPESSKINEARLSQPLCTALQIILVDILRQAGVTFTGVVGHSSGEIGAAYAAGYLSARDAIYIAYYRGLHSGLASSPNGGDIKGAMLAVGTSAEDAADLLSDPAFAGRVVVAASNSTASVTLSGDADAIEELEVILEDENKFRRRLKVDKAYHSDHMKPCSSPYMRSLRACGVQAKKTSGNCTWYSTVYDGLDMQSEEASAMMSDTYWSDNMVQPVLFSQGLGRALASETYDFALEVGPHSALQGPARQTIQDILGESLPYKGVLTRGTDAIEATSAALGFVWCSQQKPQMDLNLYEISASGIDGGFRVVKNLPSYQWDHERAYWHESRQSRNMRRRQASVHPLLGDATSDSSPHHLSWRNLLKIRELPWLSGHQLQGKPVFPAAGYISTMLEASRFMVPDGSTIRLIDSCDFAIHQAMPFDEEDAGIETVVEVSDIHHDEARQLITGKFTYSAATGKDVEALTLMASADIRLYLGVESAELLPIRGSPPPNMVNVGEDRFYDYMAELGYGYSGHFRALSSINRKLGKAECQVQVTPPSDDTSIDQLLVNPGMLDCAIQAIIIAYCHPGDGQLWSLHVPTAFKHIRVNPSLCGPSWGDAKSLPVSATTFEGDGPGLVGDVDIFDSRSSHSAIQIQGVKAVPFATPTAADDEKLFSRSSWGNINADGDDMARDDIVTKEQHELALAAERTAGYFMRKFDKELAPDHPARSDPTFSAYLKFGRHMTTLTDTGRHHYAKKEWANDTLEELLRTTERYSDTIDVRIIRAVGEAMPRVFNGETTILEHLLPTGLLTDYYVDALGMRQSSGWIGRAVEQIVHRYPRMNILEIGAGTGGATKSIFKRIGHDFESYTFTDVSTGFFEEARSVFAPYKKHMIFRALDAGADPITQGFAAGTYDLIVASFVIHATSNLEHTMRNVRKLLRPGGFVVLGEGTNQNWLRDGFVFGTLPGWWAGADEGRDLSPCIPPKRWDTVLRETGFSGIDAITPDEFMDTYATSVFVSQAVDERVDFLREPLSTPLSTLLMPQKDMFEDLVIIGGSTLRTTRLVAELKRILRSFSQNLSHFETLAEVQRHEFSPGSTVLSLTELDKPVFKETETAQFEGLKQLVSSEKTLLWVTSGRRTEDPFTNMSIGFLRNAVCENRELRFQSLDFENTRIDVRIIAESLLRLEYTSETVIGRGLAELLWSVEPEIVIDAKGRQLCPRLGHMADANNRYNSARRTVSRDVNTADVHIGIQRDTKGAYSVVDIPRSFSDSGLVLEASHALFYPINTPVGPRFLTLGTSSSPDKTVLTLTESLTSTIPMSHGIAVDCDGPGTESPRRLIALTAGNIIAASILDTLAPGQNIVVHNPSIIFAEIIARRAAAKEIDVLFIADSTVPEKQSSWTTIPSYAPKRQVQELLPTNVSLFISFSSTLNDSTILSCLPPYCRTETLEGTFPIRADLPAGGISKSDSLLADALSHALRHVQDDDADLLRDSNLSISSMTVSDVTANSMSRESLAVLEWPKNTAVHAQVCRLDSGPLFRSDKTYWLVGLSRSLGLSICDWMIARGARHVVISSRNPQVEASWEEGHRRNGVVIKIIANDVSDADAVDSIYETISSTMPPLAGIMQGAMVLNDRSIREMGIRELEDALGPKVVGSCNLDRVLGATPLDFFLFLSSMVNVVGNIGQANYCAANSFMSSLAAQRRKRGLAGSVVNIGVVTGAGYVTREVADGTGEKSLLMAGLRRISEGDTHQMLAEGIEIGRATKELTAEEEPEMNVGLRVVSEAEDWQPLWVNNPKFARFTAKESESDVGDASGQKRGASLKDRLLAAKSRDDIHELIKETFLSKLRAIMLIEGTDDETLMKSRSNDLGMDSLIAVDVRSWMLKNYSVSIPVLEILGGVYISELVNKAAEEIPSELIPNVNTTAGARSSLAPPIVLIKEDVPTSATATSAEDTPQTSQIDSASEGSSEVGIVGSSGPPSEGEEANPMLAQLESLENNSTPNLDFEKVQGLSYSQSMFWVVHSLVEDKTTLNHTAVYQVRGHLRVKSFRNAVRAVGQRHEALRTCFYEEDGQALQGILTSGTLELEYRHIFSDEEVDREYEKLQHHVYNLSSGQLMRIILLTRSAGDHYLLIGTHHINMDGICHQVFMHDVEAVYNGRATSLCSNVLQYPDFSARQFSAATVGEWDTDLAFWRQEFNRTPEPLPLTRARISNRKPLTQYNVNRHDIRVNTSLAQRIRAVVRAHKATSFHFYLAAFRVLLQRVILCGLDDDICIGIADANRRDDEMMSSFGPYVNLLPLRFQGQGHGKLTFAQALKAARDKTYAAMRHSSPPFEAILHELQVTRTANHAPLFQTFVDYRQGMHEKQKFADCSLEMIRFEPGRTAYDLSLDIIDNPGQDVMVSMLGQGALYSPEDIRQFSLCYEGILREFVAKPSDLIDGTWSYPQEEVKKALELGKGEPFNSMWPETLLHRLEFIVRKHADKVALVGQTHTLTYQQLQDTVHAIEHSLLSKGVVSGNHVAVYQPSTPELVCSMLAIMRVGAVYVPLDISTPPARLGLIIADCQPAALLVDGSTNSKCEEIPGMGSPRRIDISALKVPSISPAMPVTIGAASQPAVVLYTSGTTGTPKGVVLSHSNLVNEVEVSERFYNLDHDVVVLQQSALGFDMSVLQMFLALALGGTLVIAPASLRGDSVAIADLIVKKGVSFTCATPTEYSSWLRYGNPQELRRSSWTGALSGGEPIPESLLSAFRDLSKPEFHLFNGYGPTETTCCSTKTEVQYLKEKSVNEFPMVPAGRPSPNESVYLLDEKMRLLPPGLPGEIYIAGVGVASGYLNNSPQAKEAFLPDPFAATEYIRRGWTTMYRTKDRGRLQDDGQLVIEGRINDDTQVKVRGVRIDLQDIENTILKAAAGVIAQAVASVRKSPSLEGNENSKFIVAHVVFSPESRPSSVVETERYLLQLLSRVALPQTMRPSVLIPLETMLLTTSSKLDRRAVSALPLSLGETPGTFDREGGIEYTEAEAKLKGIWEQVLSHSALSWSTEINPPSDFFHVGGTSMLLLEVRDKIRKQLGAALSLIQLFENSTLSSMAQVVENQTPEGTRLTNWDDEAEIPPGLFATAGTLTNSAPPAARPQVILLTGATGRLGRHVLQGFLRDPSVTRVICVALRQIDDRISSGRLPAPSTRLRYYAGDLSAPRLGLSPGAFDSLAGEVDAVVHVAAYVSHSMTYASMKRANVGSTRELARFCCARRAAIPIPLHFVSTAEVAMLGRGVADAFAEESVRGAGIAPAAHDAVVRGYATTKWVAERFLENAAAAVPGLRVWIHRPSSITTTTTTRNAGSASLGAEEEEEEESVHSAPDAPILQSLLHYSRKIRAVPSIAECLRGSLDLVSMGRVTEDLVRVVLQNRPGGGAGTSFVHHTGDETIPLEGLREHLEAQQGVRFETLELSEWVVRAEAAGMHTLLVGVLENIERENRVLYFPKFLRARRTD